MPSPTAPQQAADHFSSWPLHDALLREIRVDWQKRTCIAAIEAFIDHTKEAVPHWIVWRGVKEIHIPRNDPWGPSIHINTARLEKPGVFVVEMQSGDQIQVTAEAVDLATSQV
jgi:hypothetical protein